mgnify:FL=1
MMRIFAEYANWLLWKGKVEPAVAQNANWLLWKGKVEPTAVQLLSDNRSPSVHVHIDVRVTGCNRINLNFVKDF